MKNGTTRMLERNAAHDPRWAFAAGVWVFSFLFAGTAFAQPDRKAADSPTRRIAGTFKGESLQLTVRWENDLPRGEIQRGDRTFPFEGKADGDGIKGTAKTDDFEFEFEAKLEGDTLVYKNGSRVFRLKHQVAAPGISGTFANEIDSIAISTERGTYKGTLTRNGRTFSFRATKKGNGIVGHFKSGDEHIVFAAKLEGDLLTFNAGLDVLKLKRVLKPTLGVQTRRKIQETVLVKSAEIIDSSILVSPGNQKVAYVTRRPNQFGFQVWLNERALKSQFDPPVMRFSSNDRSFAHQMKKDDKHYVVINDKPIGPYDEVIVHLDVFSPDGNRSIFAARTGQQWQIVVDGQAGPAFDRISKLFGFSTNGRRYAYIGERKGSWHVVVDGVVSPAYESVLLSWQTFSADSKHVHYAVTRNGKQIPIVDGKELDAYDAIGDMKFTPAGDRFACVVLEDQSSRVIVDGVSTPRYDHVGPLKFSADGRKLAFPVRINGKSEMIVNGKRMGGQYDQVSSPWFSADSKRILFLAQSEGKQIVVIDGEPSKTFDEVRIAMFSPDSKRVGFVARQGGHWFVVVDGKRSQPFNSEPQHLAFSPDSQHVVHLAMRGGYTYLVIDGTEGKAIWPMLRGSAIVFDDDKKFHTVVRRVDEFLRLDVEILQ